MAILIALSIPVVALGRIGVGVGIGKIEIDKELNPGGIYDLPAMPVLNTGDEPGEYEVSVEYHEGVRELRPAREWFQFSPRTFHLEPGQARIVNVMLRLPPSAKPGPYFAYLEGHPAKKSVSGQTSIGVAAAAKLYFTVASANLLQAMYYRTASIYASSQPWGGVLLAVFLGAIILVIIKRYLKIHIGISRK